MCNVYNIPEYGWSGMFLDMPGFLMPEREYGWISLKYVRRMSKI